MSNKQEIKAKRLQLLSKEEQLIADLEKRTAELESSVFSGLKTLSIIGGGVLAVGLLYKFFDSNDSAQKEKKNDKKKNKVSNATPSPVTASVISLALQKLLPLAIEKFSSLNRKDQKNEQTTESTSR
ncbi:MAG: hypothetical protein ABJF04_20240 [Reichenbachiella sp.]|uniref:hypothetical protein n=1 Tax=Reichenbachiella sp. TaxID=2184521 RepID=UPI003263435D